MENEDKLLLGGSTHQMEMEDEESEIVQQNAEVQYDFTTFLNGVGGEDFKQIFNSTINEIKAQPFEKQQEFAFSILRKIKQTRDYEFIPLPDIDNQEDLNEVYELLSFLEFEYIDFLAIIWKEMNVDVKKLDISKFVMMNIKKIISKIDEQINNYNIGVLTKRFMRTYNKDGIIKFVVSKTMKSRMLIVLRTIEMED